MHLCVHGPPHFPAPKSVTVVTEGRVGTLRRPCYGEPMPLDEDAHGPGAHRADGSARPVGAHCANPTVAREPVGGPAARRPGRGPEGVRGDHHHGRRSAAPHVGVARGEPAHDQPWSTYARPPPPRGVPVAGPWSRLSESNPRPSHCERARAQVWGGVEQRRSRLRLLSGHTGISSRGPPGTRARWPSDARRGSPKSPPGNRGTQGGRNVHRRPFRPRRTQRVDLPSPRRHVRGGR